MSYILNSLIAPRVSRINIFYITRDFWSNRVGLVVYHIWNHHSSITQPRTSELINKLGPDGTENIRKIKLHNTSSESYREILTIVCLKKFQSVEEIHI